MAEIKSTKIEASCRNCSKTLLVFPSRLARGNGRFCSRQCQWQAKRLTIEQRFSAHAGQADENGCIPWTGYLDKDGYGNICLVGTGRQHGRAHRYAYERATGQPIPDGMVVCHRCDNRYCVNPEHLFLGTPNDNTADMVAKGRNRFGEKSIHAKLTEESVRTIVRRYRAGGITQRELAHEYGVDQTAISLIMRGQNWRRVTRVLGPPQSQG